MHAPIQFLLRSSPSLSFRIDAIFALCGLFGWWVGWLVGYLVGWLVIWLVGWLVSYLVGGLVGYLVICR